HRQGLPEEGLRRRAADPLRRLDQVLGHSHGQVPGRGQRDRLKHLVLAYGVRGVPPGRPFAFPPHPCKVAMEHPGFFDRTAPMSLRVLADKLRATLPPGAEADARVRDVRARSDAERGDLAFLDNRKYLPQLAATRASACLIA